MKKILLSLALTLFWLAPSAYSWQLDPNESTVNFVSIKKGNIAETHSFSDISGSITASEGVLVIKPDSIDSKVPIRDERMREFLFETNLYPTIVVSIALDEGLDKLIENKTVAVTLPATLEMHGQQAEVSVHARVTQVNDSTLLVTSTSSVLVKATTFKMVEGIQKLSSLVNGLDIAEMVPVNFSLVFSK